jgi:hypothetical protein
MASNANLMKRNEELIRGAIRRLNKVPKEILEAALKEALTVAMQNTEVDSGNALYHWTIVGFRKSDVPDSGRVPFSDMRGQSPIGNRGDAEKGKDNRMAVTVTTLQAGYAIIEKMVWQENRVAFTIYNDLFDTDLEHYIKSSGINETTMGEISKAAAEKARVAGKKAKTSFVFMSSSGNVMREEF